jgi:hypothetical protein
MPPLPSQLFSKSKTFCDVSLYRYQVSFLFFSLLLWIVTGFDFLQLLLSVVRYLLLILALLVLAAFQSEYLEPVYFWHIHILNRFWR